LIYETVMLKKNWCKGIGGLLGAQEWTSITEIAMKTEMTALA